LEFGKEKIEINILFHKEVELRAVVRNLNLEGFPNLNYSSESNDSYESVNESQLSDEIDTMATPVVIPVVMRSGNEADRPYFFMPFSIFHSRMGDDPDSHIYQFLTCCNV